MNFKIFLHHNIFLPKHESDGFKGLKQISALIQPADGIAGCLRLSFAAGRADERPSMVRDRHKEAGGRKFVARPQGSGKSCGDPLAPVSGGGVDSSGSTHRGQCFLQISRCVRASIMPTSGIRCCHFVSTRHRFVKREKKKTQNEKKKHVL